MKKLLNETRLPLLALLLVGLSGQPLLASDQVERTFLVTVTNITRGQIFSPLVVATHSGDLDPLFVLGEEASPELAMVAEDALLDPLVAALEADPAVGDVQLLTGLEGPILPGETATVEVRAQGRFTRVTVVGMLVTTNDAFLALNGVRGPNQGSADYHSPAYDAGSENNNENCGFIPGPPCEMPEVRDEEGAEGYVHIHAGIHGISDLVPAEHDWHNPVAHISISRSHGDQDDD